MGRLLVERSNGMLAKLWFLESRGNGNQWLPVNLIGSVSNRDRIGSQAPVGHRGRIGAIRICEYRLEVIYPQATDERILAWDQRRRLICPRCTWPSGNVQSLEAIAANQMLTIHEPSR